MSRSRLRQRLARVEQLAPPPAPLPPAPHLPADDAGEVAAEVARAFGRLVEGYRQHCGLSPEEARQRACGAPEEQHRRILELPPDQVGWWDLDLLERHDPALALRRWEEVKEAARQEVRSGHRAARALEDDGGTCWGRAQFLAVRAELTEAWRPRDAMEQQLVDQLAQWHTLLWAWQETLTAYTLLSGRSDQRTPDGRQGYGPPRLSDAEALEQACRMVERLHRLYLGTLGALRERRARPPVVVRRAGQVNIGQQQVNVAR
jgi:hypothetical protein